MVRVISERVRYFCLYKELGYISTRGPRCHVDPFRVPRSKIMLVGRKKPLKFFSAYSANKSLRSRVHLSLSGEVGSAND